MYARTAGARTWFITTDTPVKGMISDCPASAKETIANGIGMMAKSTVLTRAICQKHGPSKDHKQRQGCW